MSDKAKHSPAPWRIKAHRTSRSVVAVDMEKVIVRNVCSVLISRDGAETDLANTQLIAAAPTLLAACQKFQAFDWKSGTNAGEVYEAVRLAIEQAIGEAK